ncbi:efflux RND transporter periplasmic adaptor subunit [Vibrio sp. McD22-P3]|uniref:efflux RND transporter periplasmic adaptor subunit n=1 Tax=Vibrio sp. McD22-P3 TaxID=2724880 RepID=UPI001F159302|nr:efflux RND transporter periplasmic adaptor subunit [Vibrio sp. McD22-P3]MCF4176875.1 efflux RND transporter periplasmic adaptor subunit [Vibrio sp. McD22-P3]
MMKLLFHIFIGLFSTLWSFYTLASPKVLQVKSELIPTNTSYWGLVESISESTIAAQASGRIEKIYVDVNDIVEAGSVLLEIDDTEILASIRRAEAELDIAHADNERAELEYKRYLNLSKSSFVSQEQLTRHKNLRDTSRATIKLAEARLAEFKQQLSYTNVIAPYGGIVTQRWVEVGETVVPNTPLLTGQVIAGKRVTVAIPTKIADLVMQGSQVSFSDGYHASNITVFPSVDPNTHTVSIRFDVSSQQLLNRSGDFVIVHINTGSRETIFIPRNSVLTYGDVHSVWTKSNHGFTVRPITVGEIRGNSIEVTAGLQQGDIIAADVAALLSEGE